MRNYLVTFIIMIFTLFHCASERLKIHKENGEKMKLAVLHFGGKGINRDLKYLAADYLTSRMYSVKKMPVVDRSQVNAAARLLEIVNPYFLSRRELCLLADSLQADLMVLGNVIYNPDRNQQEQTGGWMGITLRFLDGQSGEVRFIIYRNVHTKNSSYNQIIQLLDDMISAL
ncbi:MAG: hypothetical protein EH225_02905 [Calditrichaeota bacterium]|nr:MAG: hypothetical protein EH225_02905 [Calditrichota bacterium]